jgi:hypothetical protein
MAGQFNAPAILGRTTAVALLCPDPISFIGHFACA